MDDPLEGLMLTIRRSVAVMLFGAALAVSGCGGGAAPSPEAGPAASDGGAVLDDRPGARGGTRAGAEPSDGGGVKTAGGAVATDVPAPDPADYPGMDQHTPEGAEQAFKYYIAYLIWSVQSGDVEGLADLATESCEGCDALEQEISTRRENKSLWGEALVTPRTTQVHESDLSEHEISYFYEIGPHMEPPLRGSGEVEQVPSTVMVSAGGMVWVQGRWKVNGYISQIREGGPDGS